MEQKDAIVLPETIKKEEKKSTIRSPRVELKILYFLIGNDIF